MADTQAQAAPKVPTRFSTSVGSAADCTFKAPIGRTGSQYDALIEVVKKMKVGDILTVNPQDGLPAKTLRNRVTAPLRKKAEPVVKQNGGRLSIRLNEQGVVVILCKPPKAAGEAEEDGDAE